MATTVDSTPYFPQEIIDLFIDTIFYYLGKSASQKSLIACSLVSHSFRLSARKYLFSTIWLTPEPPRFPTLQPGMCSRSDNLVALLESRRSNFSSLIRKVFLMMDTGETPCHPSSGLSSVIDALRLHANNLETIWLGSPVAYTDIRWPLWDKIDPIKHAFNNLLRSSKVRNLRFINVPDLPVDIVTQFPSTLRSLELFRSDFRTVNPQLSSEPIHLKELLVYHSESDLSRLNINLSGLRKFQVSIPGAPSIWNYVESARFFIEHLNFIIGFDTAFPNLRPIDLGNFSKLRHLRLLIHATSNIDDNMWYSNIFGLLDPPTYPTPLTSIEVVFKYTKLPLMVWSHLPEDHDHSAAAWQCFSPLTLLQKHPNLETVYVKLHILFHNTSLSLAEKRHISQSLRERVTRVILPSNSMPPAFVPRSLDVDVSVSAPASDFADPLFVLR